MELFALILCPPYSRKVRAPFRFARPGGRTESPTLLQNRALDSADIFRHARLWLCLRLLCNPRDKGIEFGRGRPPSIYSVVGRDLTTDLNGI